MTDNVFAREVKPQAVAQENYLEQAERTNGQLAMIGIIAALGAYAVTGQIIPNIF